MVLCLMPTVYFFVAAFFWCTTRWDQGQQYFYLYQTGCTLPLREGKKRTSKRRRQRLASDEGEGNKVISHLFTSSAFILRPFAGSPLHFNQNFSSSFFNSEGFRPQSEAPGISFSSRSDAPTVANAAIFFFCCGLTYLALVL